MAWALSLFVSLPAVADDPSVSLNGAPSGFGRLQDPVLKDFNDDKARMLAQSVIWAIHHANQTGNYSVLRDLGTPAFRYSFSEARLAGIFEGMRSFGADLTEIAAHPPSLHSAPRFIAGDTLYLEGEQESPKVKVRYKLVLVLQSGKWLLGGVLIDTFAF